MLLHWPGACVHQMWYDRPILQLPTQMFLFADHADSQKGGGWGGLNSTPANSDRKPSFLAFAHALPSPATRLTVCTCSKTISCLFLSPWSGCQADRQASLVFSMPGTVVDMTLKTIQPPNIKEKISQPPGRFKDHFLAKSSTEIIVCKNITSEKYAGSNVILENSPCIEKNICIYVLSVDLFNVKH